MEACCGQEMGVSRLLKSRSRLCRGDTKGRPSSDLVTVDAEFSASSRQLFEFSIIDRVNGKTLINTVLDHPGGLNHRKDDRNYASNGLLGFREKSK